MVKHVCHFYLTHILDTPYILTRDISKLRLHHFNFEKYVAIKHETYAGFTQTTKTWGCEKCWKVD